MFGNFFIANIFSRACLLKKKEIFFSIFIKKIFLKTIKDIFVYLKMGKMGFDSLIQKYIEKRTSTFIK